MGDFDIKVGIYNRNKLVIFDKRKLIGIYKRQANKAVNEIRALLKDAVEEQIKMLPMKHNPVNLANGSVTSDALRRTALLQSIETERVKYEDVLVENTWEVVDEFISTATVSVMGRDFEDSHVGWYYEVGTGEESEPSLYSKYGLPPSLGDPNPYRLPQVGAPIVSRSMYNGTWVDFGGNVRTTRSPIGGVGGDKIPTNRQGEETGKPVMSPERYAKAKDSFRKYIGEDIKAHQWFTKAVESVDEEIKRVFIKSFDQIDLVKEGVIAVNPRHYLGKRGGGG